MPVEGLDLIHSLAFVWGRSVLRWPIRRSLAVVICVVCYGCCYMVATQDFVSKVSEAKVECSAEALSLVLPSLQD